MSTSPLNIIFTVKIKEHNCKPPCIRSWDFINQKWMKPVHSWRCFGKCDSVAYKFEGWMNPPKKSIKRTIINLIKNYL